MFYSKQIKYLDVYEKGEKVQNAGFVRLELREHELSMQIKAEKLRHGDNGSYSVWLRAGERDVVLDKISLEKGCGTIGFTGLNAANIAGEIGYEELEELYIKLSGERILRCILREPRVVQESSAEELKPEKLEVASLDVEKSYLEESVMPLVLQEETPEPSVMLQEEPSRDVPFVQAVGGEDMLMGSEDDGNITALQGEPKQAPRTWSEPEPILRPIPIPPQQTQGERPYAADKWQQLWGIYPHIRPFEDGRDYLKLRPEDLVLLTKRYYPLVSNSFLRHGFYNYGHLILTREKRPDGERFYIGVPGNFYEREKQVAVLYGFESFEGKKEPAKNGEFGYYMISVEI